MYKTLSIFLIIDNYYDTYLVTWWISMYDKIFLLWFLTSFSMCLNPKKGSSNRNPINLNCGHMITFVYG